MNNDRRGVDLQFREAYRTLVARLSRQFGFHRTALIEDAVSAAFLAATQAWAHHGQPDQPLAWLYRVATNHGIDELRRTIHRAVSLDADDHPPEILAEEDAVTASQTFDGEIADDELRILFVCADPNIVIESQLVFALKVMCGFSTREIARRLFTSEANIQKRLERARSKLQEHARVFEVPPIEQLLDRKEGVLQIIYLLFNEGYLSAQPERLIRRELCDEAIRLCGLLATHPEHALPEADALLALMLFQAARFDARLADDGALLLLEDQDRSRWNRAQITQGFRALQRSGRGETYSKYHAEAYIAWLHCKAPTYAETEWGLIVREYEVLEKIAPSPLHTMNRAIATAAWKGPEAGLAILQSVDPPPWLQRYYLWDAAFGELERRNGNYEAGRIRLQRALDEAPHPAERELLRKRLLECSSGDSTSHDFSTIKRGNKK